jgi:hypothetical protein
MISLSDNENEQLAMLQARKYDVGLFLIVATFPALYSSYVDWIFVVIIGFPIIGSFLIYLGKRSNIFTLDG